MIEIPEIVIDYFGRSNLPTFWLLGKVIEVDSEIGKVCREMLGEIDVTLSSDIGRQVPWLSKLAYLPEQSQGIWALSHVINEAVAGRRLQILKADHESQQMRPYEHPDLRGIEVDANGLVRLSDFDTSLGGLRRGNSVFEVLPSLANATNSMYWANRSLMALADKSEILVRLDPLMVQSAGDYKLLIQKMWVYGKALDWHEIRNLREELHMRWQPDPGWQEDVEFTDLVWSPRDDGVHFICEEIPKADALSLRGSRYLHGIYVSTEHSFAHCDGAVRLYSLQEHNKRRSTHVRKVGKTGKRIKVFQINVEIPANEWTSLAGAFFVWNSDVERYFGTSEV